MLDFRNGIEPGLAPFAALPRIPSETDFFMVITEKRSGRFIACSYQKNPRADLQEGVVYNIHLFVKNEDAAKIASPPPSSENRDKPCIASLLEVNNNSLWELGLGSEASQHALPHEARRSMRRYTQITCQDVIIKPPESRRKGPGELSILANQWVPIYRTTSPIQLFPHP